MFNLLSKIAGVEPEVIAIAAETLGLWFLEISKWLFVSAVVAGFIGAILVAAAAWQYRKPLAIKLLKKLS